MTCGGLFFLLELFMSFLSPMSHSFFLILLSCHLFILFLLWILALCLDLLLLLFFYSCKRLVDNTYPKGCTNNLKQGWCCQRAKGHLLCYSRIGFNTLISIESLSHVLNNVPQLLQKLLLAKIDFNLYLKFDFHI